METLVVIITTAVLFLGMILLLAAKPRYAGKITGTFIVIVGVGGLLLYGYGFSVTADNLPLAIIRALLAVCGMYVGKNDLSAISAAPLMQHGWMHVIFWILHLLALYATASAAITTVGAEALKKLRLWLARRGRMNLIYGIHEGSLELGKQLSHRKKNVVVFVEAKPDAAQTAAIAGAGCALRCDAGALDADRHFLRAIGLGKGRKITLYALNKDASANIRYARKLLESLRQRGIAAQQTRLVILGKDDTTARDLQVRGDQYGFGYVSVVNEPEMAARLLVRNYPPCDCVDFDENGKAQTDFEALILGFGQTGQAVLKQLVMNGQFEGSTFRAAVFAKDFQQTDGFFVSRFSALLEQYDISFHSHDGHSSQMYSYLDSRAGKIKYVVICTGNEKVNLELAEELTAYFRHKGAAVPVYQCGHNGVKAWKQDGAVKAHTRLYDADLLSRDALDQMAMILNHRYQAGTDRTPLESWMDCDYFSRQSCRASADFADAMLRMAGVTARQAMENWNPTGELLLNLSKSEHRRWNAFHFCMGFRSMSEGEFDSRAAQYLRELREQGKATTRITKNVSGCTHACLVDWDELVALSQKEGNITGTYTDYQLLDTQNVLALPELLRAAEAEG